jgi:hypothetical protein
MEFNWDIMGVRDMFTDHQYNAMDTGLGIYE